MFAVIKKECNMYKMGGLFIRPILKNMLPQN